MWGALPRTYWWAAASVAAMIIGCLGPWARLGGLSVSGLDTDDGKLFAGVAVIGAAALFLTARRPRVWVDVALFLAALVATGIGIYELVDIGSEGMTAFFRESADLVDPGWGLWLSTAGSVSLLVAIFVDLFITGSSGP